MADHEAEARRRFPEDYKPIGGNADRRRAFIEGAQWAREEALELAAVKVWTEGMNMGPQYRDFGASIAHKIRALKEAAA